MRSNSSGAVIHSTVLYGLAMVFAAASPVAAGCGDSGSGETLVTATTSAGGSTGTGSTDSEVPTTDIDPTTGAATGTGVTSGGDTEGPGGSTSNGESTMGVGETTGGETGDTSTTGDETTGGDMLPDFDPEEGWTEFKKSADTKTIYVSSSMGDDSNDGLSEAKPVKTLAKARGMMRGGFPDWMLLRRGDVWFEALGTWDKSGKSPDEPMVISTYGDSPERPLLKTGAAVGIYLPAGKTANFLAVVGLHLYAHTRDPDSPDYAGPAGGNGVRWVGNSDGLLLEDMVVQFYRSTNVNIGGNASNFKLRRSVIIDAWEVEALDQHSQGVFTMNVKGVLIEGNLIDHNGWDEEAPGANPTNYNHNIYIQTSCTGLVVRDNIITRASSYGLQARPGGLVERNLFVDNPSGLSFGLVKGMVAPLPGGVSGTIYGNVIRDSGDLSPMDPKGVGMQVSNVKSAVIRDNVMAHEKTAGPNHAAIHMEDNGVGILDLTIEDNIIFDWRGGIKNTMTVAPQMTVKHNEVQSPLRPSLLVDHKVLGAASVYEGNTYFSINPADWWFEIGDGKRSLAQWVMQANEVGATSMEIDYPDPERTLGEYHASLGKDGSFIAYLTEARKQSRKTYKLEYTAKGPIAFIRAGFGLPLVSPPL